MAVGQSGEVSQGVPKQLLDRDLAGVPPGGAAMHDTR